MSKIINIEDLTTNELLSGFSEKSYSHEDHDRWKMMLNAVRDAQEGVACSSYKKGMSILSNSFTDIPDLKELNYKMESHTGWKIMPVDGILGCEDFYKLLSRKIFPSATLVRDWHSTSFTGYPDLFHDTVGHLPLFFDPTFADFVAKSSEVIHQILINTPTGAEKEKAIQNFTRYGWFTWEAGVIKENGKGRAYGGAILSSAGETINLKERGYDEFNLQEVFNQDFTDQNFSCRYFVIDSYEDLFASLDSIKSIYHLN